MGGGLSRRREHGGVEVDAARRRGPKVIGQLGKHGRDRRCPRQPVGGGLWLVHRLHPAPIYPMIGPWAAHRVLRAGAQSRDACAAVASSRKQLVVHAVVGRSSRLNSRLNSPTGVGSMNVDKPALSTEGGGTAHIRGAEGTIILVLFVSRYIYTCCREVVITSRCGAAPLNFGTFNFIGRLDHGSFF